MLPEGLNYQSVQAIVNGIKGAGFNSIRLTFAIEMIDQMYANNGSDLPFSTSVNQALGQNASTVLDAILKNNPTFTANTTRLEVFDAVAAECNKQGVSTIRTFRTGHCPSVFLTLSSDIRPSR